MIALILLALLVVALVIWRAMDKAKEDEVPKIARFALTVIVILVLTYVAIRRRDVPSTAPPSLTKPCCSPPPWGCFPFVQLLVGGSRACPRPLEAVHAITCPLRKASPMPGSCLDPGFEYRTAGRSCGAGGPGV